MSKKIIQEKYLIIDTMFIINHYFNFFFLIIVFYMLKGEKLKGTSHPGLIKKYSSFAYFCCHYYKKGLI